jgi:hypothetical protein
VGERGGGFHRAAAVFGIWKLGFGNLRFEIFLGFGFWDLGFFPWDLEFFTM